MSAFLLDPPLVPKDGYMLRILVAVRVSDLTKQDERSLGDQVAKIERWLKERVSYPFKLTVLEGRASGELLDRSEFLQLCEYVASDRYDAVVAEDLGRIVRRMHAHIFCEECVDHNTRVIAINDNVDTARNGWEDASIFSAWHHERSNRDTSDRIKRTHRSRFSQGGCLPRELYGWIKPAGAKNDAEMSKDPAAGPIYTEWFRMLDEDRATFAEVARFLKSQGVRFPTRTPGVYADPDGVSVHRYTFNPMLKGVRERNRRKSKRQSSGKYVSVKADPGELLQRSVPHLAFFEPSYFDRVTAAVKARNGHLGRKNDPAGDPCCGRPRKQAPFPARVTVCDVCGRQFVRGGHGQTDHLMCNGARLHRCWNGVTFDGPVAAERITVAVYGAIESLEGFDPAFLQLVQEEAGRLDVDRQRRIDDLRARLTSARQGVANLLRFVKGGDESAAVRDELKAAEREAARLSAALDAAKREPTHTVELPSVERLKELGRACLADLKTGTEEFGRVMRRLVPSVRVFPVRLCDGGAVHLRGRVTVELSSLLPDHRAREVLRRPLERTLVVDLFDEPQRAKCRERVVAGRAAGRSERKVADDLGITVTAAQKAATLQRRMDELGLSDPYVRVLEPPADCTKLRRHLHPEYRFEPLTKPPVPSTTISQPPGSLPEPPPDVAPEAA
jgi:site-specific DNA recombinase